MRRKSQRTALLAGAIAAFEEARAIAEGLRERNALGSIAALQLEGLDRVMERARTEAAD